MKKSKALTWNDLADIYNETHGGRKAKTLPMEEVFDWVAKQEGFYEDPKKGTIHRRVKCS